MASKVETLGEYLFCYCLENQGGTKGYITEKIFDCFFSGSVPVYLGPTNITDYIPSSCFVDFSNFRSIEACNNFSIHFRMMISKAIDLVPWNSWHRAIVGGSRVSTSRQILLRKYWRLKHHFQETVIGIQFTILRPAQPLAPWPLE